MFNDSLSVPQCAKLVEQLSETAFPFQCAHGRFVDITSMNLRFQVINTPCNVRPSMVPLVDTGNIVLARTNRRKRPPNDWERLGTIENRN